MSRDSAGAIARRLFRHPLVHVTLISLLSFVVIAALFPEFRDTTISQIRFSEYADLYMGVFNLVTGISRPSVLLWNPYDQMPQAFHILLAGFTYSFIKTSIAILYFAFRSFFDSPGIALHVIFTVTYIPLAFLVQSIGLYLLIQRFSRSLIVLYGTIIVLNVLLSAQLILGTGAGDIHVLLPLMMHVVLSLFEAPSVRKACTVLVLFAVAVAANPFIFIQYIYQYIHVFILASLVWNWRAIGEWLRGIPVSAKSLGRAKIWVLVRGLLFACTISGLVVLPFALLYFYNFHDFYLGSGPTRLEDAFGIKAYFERPIFYAERYNFLVNMVDFEAGPNAWALQWLFIGYVPLLAVIVGLIFGTDRRKWIFFTAGLILVSLNGTRAGCARDWASVINPTCFAHWINALSSPFKFGIRSFHMAGAITLPYLVAPLSCIGMEELRKQFGGRRRFLEESKRWKKTLTVVLVLMIWYLVANELSFRSENEASQYIFVETLLALGMIVTVFSVRRKRWQSYFVVGALGLMIGWDVVALQKYTSPVLQKFHVVDERVKGIESVPISFQDQNPESVPFRYNYNTRNIGKISGYWDTETLNYSGLYYRATNLERYFKEGTPYYPRHISFASLESEGSPLRQTVLAGTEKVIFADNLGYPVQEVNVVDFGVGMPADPVRIPAGRSGLEMGVRCKEGRFDQVNVLLSTSGKVSYGLVILQVLSAQGGVLDSISMDAAGVKDNKFHVFYLNKPECVNPSDSVRLRLLRKAQTSEFTVGAWMVRSGPAGFIHQRHDHRPVESPVDRVTDRSVAYVPSRDTWDIRTVHYRLQDAAIMRESPDGQMKILSFRLPKEFPQYMSSTVYTDDRNYLWVESGLGKFVETQGRPVMPYLFDVQNYLSGMLTVTIPVAEYKGGGEIILNYVASGIEGVRKIVHYSLDDLEFLYKAPKKGWLVLYVPYDEKWKVAVNGIPIKFYSVNEGILGFEVPDGLVKVRISYWPDTPVRPLLILSAVLANVALCVLIIGEFAAVRR